MSDMSHMRHVHMSLPFCSCPDFQISSVAFAWRSRGVHAGSAVKARMTSESVPSMAPDLGF